MEMVISLLLSIIILLVLYIVRKKPAEKPVDLDVNTNKEKSQSLLKSAPRWELASTKKMYNIGSTELCLTFDNGTQHYSMVYGIAEQNSELGTELKGLKVTTSLEVAKQLLSNIPEHGTYPDDSEDPKVVVVGKVVKAEILETYDYEKEFEEQHWVKYYIAGE